MQERSECLNCGSDLVCVWHIPQGVYVWVHEVPGRCPSPTPTLPLYRKTPIEERLAEACLWLIVGVVVFTLLAMVGR